MVRNTRSNSSTTAKSKSTVHTRRAHTKRHSKKEQAKKSTNQIISSTILKGNSARNNMTLTRKRVQPLFRITNENPFD